MWAELRQSYEMLLSDETLSNGENIIIQASRLTQLVQIALKHNNKACKKYVPKVNIVKRMGLCITVRCVCEKCNFFSEDIKMFETVIRSNSHGPTAGAINHSLIVSAMKTKAGAADISFVLSSLNIKPPSMQYLYNKINQFSDKIVDNVDE